MDVPAIEGVERRANAERVLKCLCGLPKGQDLTVTDIRERCDTSHNMARKVFDYIADHGYVCESEKKLKANPNSVRSIWVDPPEAQPPPSPTRLIIEPILFSAAPIRRLLWHHIESRRFGRP